jgi:hypothetical protein
VINHFDNKAAAKELKQKQADAARRTTGSARALTNLSEAEREQLNLRIETLEAFAKTVKSAGAVLDESSRRVHATTAEHSLENERR